MNAVFGRAIFIEDMLEMDDSIVCISFDSWSMQSPIPSVEAAVSDQVQRQTHGDAGPTKDFCYGLASR